MIITFIIICFSLLMISTSSQILSSPKVNLKYCNVGKPLNNFKQSVIRVSQFNVWNFNDGPAWKTKRLQKVLQILKEENPDIIALNEIREQVGMNSMFVDFCQNFPTMFGIYQIAMKYDHDIYEGVALFSKFEMDNIYSSNLAFIHSSDSNHRVIIGATIKNTKFSFLVSHFSYDPTERIINGISSSIFIARYYKNNEKTILGDFNCYSEKDPVLEFLKDIYQLNENHHVNNSTYCNCGHSDSCQLNKRPDRVLSSLKILEFIDGPEGEIDNVCPSDHRAIFAILLIEN